MSKSCNYWHVRYYTRDGSCHGANEEGSYDSVKSKYLGYISSSSELPKEQQTRQDIVKIGSITETTQSNFEGQPSGYHFF